MTNRKEIKEAMRNASRLKEKLLKALKEENPELQVMLSVFMSLTVQTGIEGLEIPPHELIAVFAKGVCHCVDEIEEAKEETNEEGVKDEQTISRTTH